MSLKVGGQEKVKMFVLDHLFSVTFWRRSVFTRQNGQIAVALFSPYKSAGNYFRYYLQLAEAISGSEQTKPCSKRNSCRTVLFAYVLNGLVLLKAVHFLALYAWSPLSDEQQLVHFDVLNILVPNSKYNLFAALSALVTVYFNHILFFKTDVRLNGLLREVLYDRRTTFFLWPTFKGRPVVELVRRFLKFVINLFHIFVLVTDCLFVYIYIKFTLKLLSLRHHLHELPASASVLSFLSPSSSSPASDSSSSSDLFTTILYLLTTFLIHNVSSLLLWVFFYNLAHIFTIAFAASSTLVFMFFIKMRQNYLALLQSSRRTFKLTGFSHFHANFELTLGMFFRLNAMYGRLFLSGLVAMVPISTRMIIWILNGQVSRLNSVFIILYIVHECYCIFGIHLFLALCSTTIHRPSSELMHLMVVNQHRVGHLRTRIRLSNMIFALHVPWQQRYGFMYGQVLVTMAAFVKYLMMYGRYMIITYRLINYD